MSSDLVAEFIADMLKRAATEKNALQVAAEEAAAQRAQGNPLAQQNAEVRAVRDGRNILQRLADEALR